MHCANVMDTRLRPSPSRPTVKCQSDLPLITSTATECTQKQIPMMMLDSPSDAPGVDVIMLSGQAASLLADHKDSKVPQLVRSVHQLSSGNYFLCRYCGRIFASESGRRQHERLHAGTAFCCDLCKKTFTTNAGLQRHKQSLHEKKPHVCLECGKSFSWTDSLRRHQKTSWH